MQRTLLSLVFGILLVGCASHSVKPQVSAERSSKEEECLRKIVGDRTYGNEVPAEEILAYSGGEWKVRQVRVFQKIIVGKSPAIYFAYVVEPINAAKDIDQSNTKITLLCESSPEYRAQNNSIMFPTSFDAVHGYYSEVAKVQADLDQYSVFNKTAWFSAQKGNFMIDLDKVQASGLVTKVIKLTSKEADIRHQVEATTDEYYAEILSSASYELRGLPR